MTNIALISNPSMFTKNASVSVSNTVDDIVSFVKQANNVCLYNFEDSTQYQYKHFIVTIDSGKVSTSADWEIIKSNSKAELLILAQEDELTAKKSFNTYKLSL